MGHKRSSGRSLESAVGDALRKRIADTLGIVLDEEKGAAIETTARIKNDKEGNHMSVQHDRDEQRIQAANQQHADHPYICPRCEGTGWQEIKRPIAGQVYCICPTGQRKRKEAREREQADWQAAKDAGLWNNPDQWPW